MVTFVATPIGNLKDITLRALETLKNADVIFCEDTRHTLKLLNAYEIRKPLLSCHKFNEREAAERIAAAAREGKEVAIVSDAGMPVISDPGNLVCRTLREQGIAYTVAPGANAALSALILSGLPADRFAFVGFLPEKAGEKRELLERYARGRDTLNMFCYTGGFSFYAMRGGARLVHSVDSSARAIELTKQNVELNFPEDSRHEAFVDEAFHFLEHAKDRYDLIVLDPPAFAKHQKVLDNAIQGYKKLNRKGIEIIRSGGIIFTFSCSQVMTKELFRQTVFTAAANTGRRVKILHQLTQPADHPINIYHPEGEYLKGLVLYVE